MNIKNIKGYVRRSRFLPWTRTKIYTSSSYNDIKNILINQIEVDRSISYKLQDKKDNIFEERARQAEDLLRIMGY